MAEERARLARTAEHLGRLAACGKPAAVRSRLPSLWLFTDPDRLPDPMAAAAVLPRGAGVVLRTFGRPEAERLAPALAALSRRRGLLLLVGEDAALAARIGADGVHLPQRALALARRLRLRHPRWRLTADAHDARALRAAARAGVDAAFLSPVFDSASPSAGEPLGALRAARMVAAATLPVYALGGVTASTARRLATAGLAGFAAINGLRT